MTVDRSFGMERSIALLVWQGRSLFWYGKVDRSFGMERSIALCGMERSIVL
ncbi:MULTISPECIES: hypothetical protein [unclassified Microcoleus]|uniref:hypothetical protein n=1 Tax=unclassified Microcoleus TaxID=2642155 RepID=UPI002FD63961